ncbi:SDR family oxidoreductase [Brachybacterium kimchii]|uniref:SDR family oxidoreductase n=1 Tax=Brachybacterium kimchii TaxID=2942909 RepID=A0ABY4N3G8_9MICO|nr:SDR family oxidoreductase [Brachybacterium kimchii]UQN28689.1 SDR family oxidoreductase [Brachybacterium kimchii]
MKVFVTGATGFIGSAVVPELISAGHEVVGLARSERSAARLQELGASSLPGDLTDLDALRRGVAATDSVVHLAFSNDFTAVEAGVEEESRAVHAMGEALAERALAPAPAPHEGPAFVIASGTPAIPGRASTEDDPYLAEGPMAARARTAQYVMDLAAHGVRPVAVRLPRSVHQAHVRYGFASMLIQAAQRSGVSGFVGDGGQRWPAVHVKDAARLFRLALERADAGFQAQAVADEGDAMRDIAAAIGEALDLPVQSVDAETFGFLGQIFALDQPASSRGTRSALGWEPTHPSLLEDLRAGRYPS